MSKRLLLFLLCLSCSILLAWYQPKKGAVYVNIGGDILVLTLPDVQKVLLDEDFRLRIDETYHVYLERKKFLGYKILTSGEIHLCDASIADRYYVMWEEGSDLDSEHARDVCIHHPIPPENP